MMSNLDGGAFFDRGFARDLLFEFLVGRFDDAGFLPAAHAEVGKRDGGGDGAGDRESEPDAAFVKGSVTKDV